MTIISDINRANKTDADNGSKGICRVIDASRSPSPDPKRFAGTKMIPAIQVPSS